MPGDCHIHMVLDGVEWRSAIVGHIPAPDEHKIHAALKQYQSLGYTYLRDGGDRWGVGAKARQLAAAYGIRYTTPLAPICKAGHYGSFIGETFSDFKEYAALVRQHRQEGADFIKIMISGLMDFDRFGVLTEEGLPADEIQEMTRIAHHEGMPVMAHCNGARTMEAAAAAGIDSIEHGAYPDIDALQAMVENRVIWVPTLSTIGNLRGKGRFSEAAVQAIFENQQEAVFRFAELGGTIAPGSDAGAWSVPHGCDTEIAYLPPCAEEGLAILATRFPGTRD